MCHRTVLLFLVLFISGCMCWPPIPNASVHSRRSRVKSPQPSAPAERAMPLTCEIDFAEDWSACDPQFEVDAGDASARIAVDVPEGHQLVAQLEVCDPAGWVLNVGDSPTNDGGGGDYGSTSNDAEFQIRGTTLDVFGSDYAIGSATRRQTVDGFLSPGGCQSVTAEVRDREIVLSSGGRRHVFRGEALLRLNPPRDDEGAPDWRWFIGLNRVIDGTRRRGTGVVRATISVVSDAPRSNARSWRTRSRTAAIARAADDSEPRLR